MNYIICMLTMKKMKWSQIFCILIQLLTKMETASKKPKESETWKDSHEGTKKNS